MKKSFIIWAASFALLSSACSNSDIQNSDSDTSRMSGSSSNDMSGRSGTSATSSGATGANSPPKNTTTDFGGTAGTNSNNAKKNPNLDLFQWKSIWSQPLNNPH